MNKILITIAILLMSSQAYAAFSENHTYPECINARYCDDNQGAGDFLIIFFDPSKTEGDDNFDLSVMKLSAPSFQTVEKAISNEIFRPGKQPKMDFIIKRLPIELAGKLGNGVMYSIQQLNDAGLTY